jgi:hypothetical protein
MQVNKKDRQRFISIHFNAWKYSKSEAIWAAFYSRILMCIEDNLTRRDRIRFRNHVARETDPWWYYGWRVGVLFFLLIFAVLWVVLPATPESTVVVEPEYQIKEVITVVETDPVLDSMATLVIRQPKPAPEPFFSPSTLTLTGLLPLAAMLFSLIGAFRKSMRSLSLRMLAKVKKGGTELRPLTQAEVVKYVESVKEWLELQFKEDEARPDSGKRFPERFVVFIDDIDRVQPNKIMQMMEAIKLFLETPRFVFVMAMDARIVRMAIGEHYRFMAETSSEREVLGHDYLEKIVQIPFYLPKIAKDELKNLTDQLLRRISKPQKDVSPAHSKAKGSIDEEQTGGEVPDGGKPTSTAPPKDTADETGATIVTPTTTLDQSVLDDTLDMEISEAEHNAVNDLVEAGMEMSPRQMKRFWNVYFLARHIFFRSFPGKPAPPIVFASWIALSVRYPFEVKELVRASILESWPANWQTVVNRMVQELRGRGVWDDMQKNDLLDLATLLSKYISSPKTIQQFVGITNCFNLVLE